MGRPGRRPPLSLAVVVIIGVVAVVSIAVAGRTSTPARIEVSSPVSADSTTTSASTVIATDTRSATDTTTTPAETPTTPVSTSTSTTTDTAAPTSASESTTGTAPVSGTYFGVEHFALFTGRCAFLDHHIVGTFTPSDETTWTFHQDYCGTLQGDLWSGVGTFSLTASDGAAITGTVNETNIKVPSPGVPYTIVVTAGTHRFSGATGTCRLDNHLRVIQFGLQDDYGTFTCNIAV